jgi:flagellar protein FlaF
MSSAGYTVYKSVQTNKDDPRDLEYRLLAQVTGALIQVRDNNLGAKERVAAAKWNRDIWSALRQDLMNENNQLPKELRASLVSISLWIEKEALRVMEGSGDINAMIDVNRNIMAGLKPKTDETETGTPA